MDSYELEYRHVPLLPWELRNDYGPPIVGYDAEKHAGLFSRDAFPMVPITLVGPDGDELQEWAAVDSGADHTCIPIELMAALGITVGMCEMQDASFDGAVTPYPRYTAGIETRVLSSWRMTLRPHFIGAWRFVLLGREDFGAAFRWTLDERAAKLTLEAYDDVERIPDPNEAELAKIRAELSAA